MAQYYCNTGKVKSKKELKEKYVGKSADLILHDESLFGDGSLKDGNHCFVGPGPANLASGRKFYGNVTIENGVITKVK